ncbi:MAG TPA: OmpA family protein [Gammaproteobacteria bacterium]|nr:OmpA family protein [Gammaproteobacteria bacterium]
MKVKIIGTLVMCAASMQVMADNAPYWSGSDGNYARGRDGHCVRTITWTAKDAIAGCEGGKTAAAKPAPAAKPEPVAKSEPVAKPEPVAKATSAAPEYTDLSLASGASFKLGGSTLSADGKAAVANLISKFDGETIDSVVVEGYTDDRGAASFNQQLSEKRASAVKAELVKNGVDADKISTVGYGEANPVASNGTREGRAQNRRVVIKVDGKRRQL